MFQKIDSILFRVKDIHTSSIYYQKVLGLKKVWQDKERKMIGFVFVNDDSEIVIHENLEIPSPSFSFLVENVIEFCTIILKKGHSVIEEPFDVRTGKFAIIADPDGNHLPIIDLTSFEGVPRYNID